jgi:hypothetical protein
MNPKLTYSQFNAFYNDFKKGEFPHQRLSQAFVNTFTMGEPCPDIFYETDERVATDLIVERYVIIEKQKP